MDSSFDPNRARGEAMAFVTRLASGTFGPDGPRALVDAAFALDPDGVPAMTALPGLQDVLARVAADRRRLARTQGAARPLATGPDRAQCLLLSLFEFDAGRDAAWPIVIHDTARTEWSWVEQRLTLAAARGAAVAAYSRRGLNAVPHTVASWQPRLDRSVPRHDAQYVELRVAAATDVAAPADARVNALMRMAVASETRRRGLGAVPVAAVPPHRPTRPLVPSEAVAFTATVG